MLYKVEVMDLDQHLRRLLDGLETTGFLKDAVILFTADHGEEFYEHGWYGHASSLYEAAIRVPLLIVSPGQTTRKDVTENVELSIWRPLFSNWRDCRGPIRSKVAP